MELPPVVDPHAPLTMGAGASAGMRSPALAALAEEKDYEDVASVIMERKINAPTALMLNDEAVNALSEDIITRMKIKSALGEFKRAVSEGEDGAASKHTLDGAARPPSPRAPRRPASACSRRRPRPRSPRA